MIFLIFTPNIFDILKDIELIILFDLAIQY